MKKSQKLENAEFACRLHTNSILLELESLREALEDYYEAYQECPTEDTPEWLDIAERASRYL